MHLLSLTEQVQVSMDMLRISGRRLENNRYNKFNNQDSIMIKDTYLISQPSSWTALIVAQNYLMADSLRFLHNTTNRTHNIILDYQAFSIDLYQHILRHPHL